jgi:hypothetical protein
VQQLGMMQRAYQQVTGARTRALIFREFVIYDHGLCYPEFLIEYERI